MKKQPLLLLGSVVIIQHIFRYIFPIYNSQQSQSSPKESMNHEAPQSWLYRCLLFLVQMTNATSQSFSASNLQISLMISNPQKGPKESMDYNKYSTRPLVSSMSKTQQSSSDGEEKLMATMNCTIEDRLLSHARKAT